MNARTIADVPPLETRFEWPQGKRAALSITFDDARPSQVDVGIPLLNKHGVRGSFYVIMYHLEKREDAWKAAVDAGHEIGNHTMSHPCSGNFNSTRPNRLEDYTPARMEEEFYLANEAIHSKLGVTPTTFAYPCGQTFIGRGSGVQSYIPLVAKHFQVGRRGFDECPTDPAFCDLAQVTAMDFDGLDFECCKDMIDRTITRGGWLNLHGHEVGTTGKKPVFTDTLERLCLFCNDEINGIWIDTVANIGDYVRQKRIAGNA